MTKLLLEARDASEDAAAAGKEKVPARKATRIRLRYHEILDEAFSLLPPGPPPRLRHRGGWFIVEREAWNLASRLKTAADDVLRLLDDTAVPLTNNAAERSLPLAALRPSELQAWMKRLSTELQPATVEVVYRYVVAILRAAVADRVIAASPAVGIRLPKIPPRQVVPLETEVVEALISSVPARYTALVLLAAGTGMRQGECFGLTADRVEFLRRQVKVDRQLVLLPGGGPVFGPPKTQASYRTIPLPRVVIDALAAHMQAIPVGPDGLVFTNDAGEPIRRTRFSDFWRPAVVAAKAPAGTGFHALRHYYASLLIRHGESVKVVQARLGHASAAETLDTYSHLWPDSEDQTRAAVDEVLGSPRGHSADTRRGPVTPAAGQDMYWR
jgi:integrase